MFLQHIPHPSSPPPRDDRHISLPSYYQHDVLFCKFLPATNIAEVTLGNNLFQKCCNDVMYVMRAGLDSISLMLRSHVLRIRSIKVLDRHNYSECKNVGDRCFNKNMDIKFSPHDALIGF